MGGRPEALAAETAIPYARCIPRRPATAPDASRTSPSRRGRQYGGPRSRTRNRAIAACLFATNLKGVSSVRLRRDPGTTQRPARFMVRRLGESRGRLAGVDGAAGPGEIYGASFGGLGRNRRRNGKGAKSKTTCPATVRKAAPGAAWTSAFWAWWCAPRLPMRPTGAWPGAWPGAATAGRSTGTRARP